MQAWQWKHSGCQNALRQFRNLPWPISVLQPAQILPKKNNLVMRAKRIWTLRYSNRSLNEMQHNWCQGKPLLAYICRKKKLKDKSIFNPDKISWYEIVIVANDIFIYLYPIGKWTGICWYVFAFSYWGGGSKFKLSCTALASCSSSSSWDSSSTQ